MAFSIETANPWFFSFPFAQLMLKQPKSKGKEHDRDPASSGWSQGMLWHLDAQFGTAGRQLLSAFYFPL